jgi:type I restriction enzyme R subunit
VEDLEVRMCSHLKGKDLWFLPFNRVFNYGEGNPSNPDGLKTAYLREQVLTRRGLTEIVENYTQIVEEKSD